MPASIPESRYRNARQAAVCDVHEPWAHGTVVRASRFASYYDFNVVRVEEDPAMTAEELATLADEALAGLAHRRVDFDLAGVAEPLRPEFDALGWKAARLVWMRHEAPPPPRPELPVEEVPYDAVHELRMIWHGEDFPDHDPGDYHEQSREVALRCGARVLALLEGGVPIAYTQIEREGLAAEIAQVYVHPGYRGGGRGTAITRAAIEAAGAVRDLWIVADDEDRPKRLYARLGFRPAWTETEFLRLP